MIYFLPAWYQGNEWSENEQKWYMRRTHTEFDDTVKQIQLFHRNQVYPYMILLLSQAPNLRHFLHRQSVYHAPYWSCFDAICEVRRTKVATLSYHNLKWPDNVEFIFTPFAIVAQIKGQKYAQVEFGEDGNMIEVDIFREGQLIRKNIYDDRGFISRTTVYRDRRPIHTDYLMENGIWKLRCDCATGEVTINPACPTYLIEHRGQEETISFRSKKYKDLSAVIEEVTETFLTFTEEEDLFCAAMHVRHLSILERAFAGRRMILSFFEDRFDLLEHQEAVEFVKTASCVVTDSRDDQSFLEAVTRGETRVVSITPFDSRADFGISQQLPVQKVLVPVDHLDERIFSELICAIGSYLPQNEKAEIHLLTRRADYDLPKKILGRTQEILRAAGMEKDWANEKKADTGAENNIDEEEDGKPLSIRFFVEQCVDELSVSRCMRETRLIIDLREFVEVYLQINALSAGIPQIVYKGSQFVEDGKNGRVVCDLSMIPEYMGYYLESLTNWNEAMVASFDIGKKYTTKVLLSEWKEVIDLVRQDKDPSAGQG